MPLDFIGEFAENTDTLVNIQTNRQKIFVVQTLNVPCIVDIYAGNNLTDKLLSIDTSNAGGFDAAFGIIMYWPTSGRLSGCGIGKGIASTPLTGQDYAATNSLRVVVSNSPGAKACIYALVVS